MSFFSVAQAAPVGKFGSSSDGRVLGSGTTPITGTSSGGSGPVSNGGGSTTSPNSNGGSTGGGSSLPGGGGNGGNGGSIGSTNNGGSMGSSASPVTSGNRPGDTGNNAPRPGPRTGEPQPNAGSNGPFTKTPNTMDGTGSSGFNFGSMVNSLYYTTSSIMSLVATFAMLKSLFGWFGGKKEKTPAESAKTVVAVATSGTNVARDAVTKTDRDLDAARDRADGGRGRAGGAAETDDAEGAGMAPTGRY